MNRISMISGGGRERREGIRQSGDRRKGRPSVEDDRANGDSGDDAGVGGPSILRLVGSGGAYPCGVPEPMTFTVPSPGELLVDLLTPAQWEKLGEDRWNDFCYVKSRNLYVRWRIVPLAD